MEWYNKIRERREELGLSQADLARDIGVSQQTINKIEQGLVRTTRSLPRIAKRLQIPIAELDEAYAPHENEIIPLRTIEGSRTREDRLPLYGAVEGGAGVIVVEKEPIGWVDVPDNLRGIAGAYAVLVVGDSMVPEYRPGDELHIHPKMPIIPDASYVFYTNDGGNDRATIKHLVKATETEWLVEQHNPARQFTLSRAEWPRAERVTGKKNRR